MNIYLDLPPFKIGVLMNYLDNYKHNPPLFYGVWVHWGEQGRGKKKSLPSRSLSASDDYSAG